jgi:hypothetical protein
MVRAMRKSRTLNIKVGAKKSRPAATPSGSGSLRKAVVLAASSLFLYGLFRDMNLAKTLLLIAGLVGAFVVSRVPTRAVIGVKYPLICLSFALSGVLFFYPSVRGHLAELAALFLSFYSIALYLATDEDKAKQPYKQMIALSLLFISSSFNLIVTSRPEVILPLAITSLLFLFILNRVKSLPIIGAYTLVILVVLYVRQCTGFGCDLRLTGIERYLLLGTALLLLFVSFIGFIKESGPVRVVAFFGSLYLSIDLLMSIGFSFRGILMHQPSMALLIVSPLLGLTMKGAGGRP